MAKSFASNAPLGATQFHALSPSSLTFNWQGCRRCYWLEARGLKRPYMPFPAIFNAFDAQMKAGFQGERLEELIAQIPGCVMQHADEWVVSAPIVLQGKQTRYFFRGKFDTTVLFDDRTVGVIDFKTSARKAEHIPLYARQLHAYAYALEHPAPGAFTTGPITRLGLVVFEPKAFLATGSNAAVSTGYLRWIEIPRDDATFCDFLEEVIGILDQPIPPPGAPGCDLCRYREAGRRVQL